MTGLRGAFPAFRSCRTTRTRNSRRTTTAAAFRDTASVAYDEALAERIRALTSALPGTSEQRMFGGLAFLVNGNMAIAASGGGGVLVRCDAEAGDELAQQPGAERMVMRGRAMDGWLRVAAASVEGDSELERWVSVGVDCARALPPKP